VTHDPDRSVLAGSGVQALGRQHDAPGYGTGCARTQQNGEGDKPPTLAAPCCLLKADGNWPDDGGQASRSRRGQTETSSTPRSRITRQTDLVYGVGEESDLEKEKGSADDRRPLFW